MLDESGDKSLVCVDCGVQFTFSARDQAFYQERGYQAPRRCKVCRDKRKSGQMPTGSAGGFERNAGGPPSRHAAATPASGNVLPGKEQFKVNCSGCGVETTVPFKPDPNRPVYCRTCYISRRKDA
jgi:CxxC-x17-CxxC domain-containing protein